MPGSPFSVGGTIGPKVPTPPSPFFNPNNPGPSFPGQATPNYLPGSLAASGGFPNQQQFQFGGTNSPVSSPFHGAGYQASQNNYTPNPNSTSPFFDSTKQPYGFGPGQDQGPLTSGLNGPMDPYQALLQELSAMSSGGPSTADLSKQANQQAGLQFDPLIKQLQDNLAGSKKSEGIASGKVGDIYNSLGRALAAQMPVITGQFANAENQSKQSYQGLQNQISQNYQGAQAQQQSELEKLGIQAASGQANAGLQRDQQYLTGQAATNGQALNDAMRLMGQGESDFAQRASQIAPQQGANTQADMAQKLLALETQINQQVAGYQQQKGSTAASLLAQLQSAASTNSNKAQQDAISQALSLGQLDKLYHPDKFAATPTKPTNYNGISGVSQFLADNAGSQSSAAKLQADFNDFLNSPELNKLTGPGGVGSPSYVNELAAMNQYMPGHDSTLSPDEKQQLLVALAILNGKY